MVKVKVCSCSGATVVPAGIPILPGPNLTASPLESPIAPNLNKSLDFHVIVPVFFIRIDTEYVCPTDIEVGKLELITWEFLYTSVTETVLVEVAPNHATPSCTILYDGL